MLHRDLRLREPRKVSIAELFPIAERLLASARQLLLRWTTNGAPFGSAGRQRCTCRALLLLNVVVVCTATATAASLNLGDVLKSLASSSEGFRTSAISALARSGEIPSPIGSADGVAILQGTTQGARAGAIAELASLFKKDLSGLEAEAILGSETTLSEGNRQAAVSALARAGRFGPSIGDDAALALKGATQGPRAVAIGEIAPYLRADLPGQAIATILGSGVVLSEGHRQSAIASLARSRKKFLPLTGSDGAAILQGSTQGARAGAINELASMFKADLRGDEAALILGSGATLSEGHRQSAITSLARGSRFGPSLSADAALMLEGATQGSRAAAIAEIAPYLRQDLSGQSLAGILGDPAVLIDGHRQSAIASLARAGRVRQCIPAAEAALLMVGARQGSRAGAIAEIARYVGPTSQVADLAQLLGTSQELSEGNRVSAVAALARSGAVRKGFTTQELAAVLDGTSAQNRALALSEISNAAAPTAQMTSACAKASSGSPGTIAGNAGGAPAPGSASGTASAVSTSASGSMASGAQGLQDRIARLRRLSNNVDPYAYGTDTLVDQVNVVAMDLPRMLGFQDFRAIYDQSYFGALQYRILANRTLDRAQTALRAGNAAEAQRQADRATILIRQEKDSFSAAQAALDRDAARATTYVRLVYESSKAASSIVAKVSHIPGATSAVDALWVLTDAGVAAADDGLAAGEKELIADVLTKVIMKSVPLDILGGKTIESVLDGTAGKLISDSGIRAAVRRQIADPVMRKAVLVAATQALSDALGKPFEAKTSAGLDRAIAGLMQG